jgi:hypothetical protein
VALVILIKEAEGKMKLASGEAMKPKERNSNLNNRGANYLPIDPVLVAQLEYLPPHPTIHSVSI